MVSPKKYHISRNVIHKKTASPKNAGGLGDASNFDHKESGCEATFGGRIYVICLLFLSHRSVFLWAGDRENEGPFSC
jgi:hypothetical protein